MREVVAVVNRPQDIEDEEAMSFFGDQRAMRMRVRVRLNSKAPERVRGVCCLLFGCVRNQAAIVRAFFCVISSSARSQSSNS